MTTTTTTTMISTITLVVLICTTSLLFTGINNNNIGVDAFLVMPSYPTIKSSTIIKSTTSIVAQRFNQQQEQFFYRNDNNNLILYAGGFEWEDPIETISADSIDNPYKNPSLLQQKSEGTDEPLVIDPARLLSPRLHGSNLYFIGMMGSGKSTIAQLIAKRMGSYVYLDTDDIIEKAVGKTINEIFQQDGENEFRNVESQVLSSVYAYVRCVISTGGGIIIRRDNWSKLQTGIVVWLDVTPNVIIERLQQKQNNGIQSRPLLQTENPLETIENLLNERIELYSNADVRIVIDDMNETTEMISNRVIRDIHNFIDTHPPAWKLAQQKQQEQSQY